MRLVVTALVVCSLACIGFLSNRETNAQVGSTTAVVGVAKTPTAAPTNAEIDAAVRQAIALAGGIPAFDSGKKIVIQPNFVEAGWTPNNGVTTNLQVIKTIVEMCVEAGAVRSNITICEGSAGFRNGVRDPGYTVRQMTWQAYMNYGVNTIAGVNFVDANDCGTGNYYPSYPGYTGGYSTANHYYYYQTTPPPNTPATQVPGLYVDRLYAIPKCVVDCDYFIRIPVLKNHDLAGVTGALKLAFGLAPADIYHIANPSTWLGKWNLLHQWQGVPWSGVGSELENNARGMVDMTLLRPPDLVVCDGLVGIYTGPTREPLGQSDMACILASTDPVAADTIQCLAMGYKIDSVPSLTRAASKGLGTNNPGKIEVRGYRVKDIRRWFSSYGCAVAGDRNAPTMSGLSIADGTHVCGQLHVAPASPADSNPGLCKGELYVDGLLVDSSDANGYKTSWLVGNQSEGAHTATYILYDRMLNEAPLSKTVYVHKGDPVRSALGLADGAAVSMGTVIYMGSAPGLDSNTFFVSSPDGLTGLRVRYASTAPSFPIGHRIGLYGTMSTTGGQRFLNCTYIATYDTGSAPRPRYMRNKAIGGAALNAGTPGVTRHYGPYNMGCLVRTSGKVIANGSGYFVISDGSIRAADDGADGIKVKSGSISQPALGSTVRVAGFSCCEDDGGVIRPMIAVRTSADIQ